MAQSDKKLYVLSSKNEEQILNLFTEQSDVSNNKFVKIINENSPLYMALGGNDGQTSLRFTIDGTIYTASKEPGKKVIVVEKYQSGEDIYHGHAPIYSTYNLYHYLGEESKTIEEVPFDLDISQVDKLTNFFRGCAKLKKAPKLKTSHITDMYTMFSGCQSLEEIPEMDTSSVTRMDFMFQKCTSLPKVFPWPLDLSGFTGYEKPNAPFSGSSVEEVTIKNASSYIKSMNESTLLRTMGRNVKKVNFI